MIYSNSKRVDSERMSAEIIVLKDRIMNYQENIHSLQSTVKRLEQAKEKQKDAYEAELAEKNAIIKALENTVVHMTAVAERNGSNAGISTAATPMNQKKKIPNSRRGSNKTKGGQPGHKKHTMETFETSEITDTISHELNVSTKRCDVCEGELIDTGNVVFKDEFDVNIQVIKRRHEYHIYKCVDCGAECRQLIEPNLKEANQYGNTVQAVALSLMVTGNVAINKVGMLLNGMTGGMMHPSEGFICKLYQRAALKLEDFIKDLRVVLIQRAILYWDDTVIMIKTKRACMRFYGDESIAYYTAHASKNLEGILEDDILTVLTDETTVMHDHNKVNYNEQFSFRNIECIQHLQRDIQKVADDNPTHTWAMKLKELISQTIRNRKELIGKEESSFSDEDLNKFSKKIKKLIKRGYKESSVSTNPTTVPSEGTLLKRIEEYYDNYFMWVQDFSLPTTDNLSERGLRGIKSHLKISGQFDSEKTASYFATVKTYVETCRKNGLNEQVALSRLCAGNPYTVAEIFNT